MKSTSRWDKSMIGGLLESRKQRSTPWSTGSWPSSTGGPSPSPSRTRTSSRSGKSPARPTCKILAAFEPTYLGRGRGVWITKMVKVFKLFVTDNMEPWELMSRKLRNFLKIKKIFFFFYIVQTMYSIWMVTFGMSTEDRWTVGISTSISSKSAGCGCGRCSCLTRHQLFSHCHWILDLGNSAKGQFILPQVYDQYRYFIVATVVLSNNILVIGSYCSYGLTTFLYHYAH
jgi:hypothetical protein